MSEITGMAVLGGSVQLYVLLAGEKPLGDEDGVTIFLERATAEKYLRRLRQEEYDGGVLHVMDTTVNDVMNYCRTSGVGFNLVFSNEDSVTASARDVAESVSLSPDEFHLSDLDWGKLDQWLS